MQRTIRPLHTYKAIPAHAGHRQESYDMTYFKNARPVWLTGREKEKNCVAGFICCFNSRELSGNNLVLSIASSGIYRACLNGSFLGHGPARAAHGYFRVDRIALPSDLLQENNILTIEVISFYVNSFYIVEQPGFLQAELQCDDKVIRFTDADGDFRAHILKERLQKVQRYSFQLLLKLSVWTRASMTGKKVPADPESLFADRRINSFWKGGFPGLISRYFK